MRPKLPVRLASRVGILVALMVAARAGIAIPAQATPKQAGPSPDIERLIAAYSTVLSHIEGGMLVWRDGTRMPISDGHAGKSLSDWLSKPSLEDMFRWPYPAGAPLEAPPPDTDPARTRHAAFFAKLYGDCTQRNEPAELVEVTWLPKKHGRPVTVSARHGMPQRLKAVSAKLDALPARFDRFLFPLAGSVNCRPVAGENRLSAHGYGIAIDLPITTANYWLWDRSRSGTARPWRNSIPAEIVAAFESEGFVWGGRWSHYDTMHFEYRPEMFAR